jgi:NAD(P)-dependent dehydrogenase (short-subunit alcohol dehydrogenase family)
MRDVFKDKVAIVTGGASGIGRALCEELGRRGAAVVPADINAEGAAEVASVIKAAGGRARPARVDVSQAAQVQKLVDDTVSEHGRLDYIFNNAGVAVLGDMRDMEVEHWRRALDVNLWGVIHGTMSAYRVMVGQGSGHIVNTASAAGLMPTPFLAAYSASKHAVVGLSTSLRAEAADLGVKVSVVCPGSIRTRMAATATYLKVNREALLARMADVKKMDASKCAQIILRGVARNKAVITVTGTVRLAWWLQRIHPPLLSSVHRKWIKLFRSFREVK